VCTLFRRPPRLPLSTTTAAIIIHYYCCSLCVLAIIITNNNGGVSALYCTSTTDRLRSA
jgi:hypothetical protein